jgi:hypothetical protein
MSKNLLKDAQKRRKEPEGEERGAPEKLDWWVD